MKNLFVILFMISSTASSAACIEGYAYDRSSNEIILNLDSEVYTENASFKVDRSSCDPASFEEEANYYFSCNATLETPTVKRAQSSATLSSSLRIALPNNIEIIRYNVKANMCDVRLKDQFSLSTDYYGKDKIETEISKEESLILQYYKSTAKKQTKECTNTYFSSDSGDYGMIASDVKTIYSCIENRNSSSLICEVKTGTESEVKKISKAVFKKVCE